MHLLKTAVIAYPFATWIVGIAIVVRGVIGGLGFDGTSILLIITAPVGVPLLVLYGLGNWIDGYRKENEILWWCAAVVLAWILCFAAVSTRAARRLGQSLGE